MHFFHLSGRADGPPFCFCNGARNFSEISGGREGGREEGREEGGKAEKRNGALRSHNIPSPLSPLSVGLLTQLS